MRVLHVIPSLAARTGGPALFVVEGSRALEDLGVRSTVYATTLASAASSGDPRPTSIEELPPGGESLDVRLFPVQRPVRFATSRTLGRALRARAGEFDVVHVHSLYLYPTYAAAREARKAGVPYVVTPHGSLDPWIRRRGRVRKAVADLTWQRRALERAAALQVATAGERRALDGVAPAVRRVVVPYGIHWERFQDAADGDLFRRRFLGGTDAPLLLNIGRISEKKRLDVLVRALALVRADLDVRLAIVGPDEEDLSPRLRRLAESLGVGSSVSFTGMLIGRDRMAALAGADVWALPSAAENFGIAAVEAMAAGVPAIVSSAMDIAPEVTEAGAGLVCESTPEAVAESVAGIVSDERLRARLSETGRAFARRYDWSVVGPELAGVYAEVAGQA
jgi:glycosyltransferase involved in cell wall biosynthesis